MDSLETAGELISGGRVRGALVLARHFTAFVIGDPAGGRDGTEGRQ